MKTILTSALLAALLVGNTPLLAQQSTEQKEIAKAAYFGPQLSGTLYEQGARWNSKVWQTPYRENLTDDEKRTGLALLWSEVKYNFAYFDHVPNLDWDSLYVAYQPKVVATKSTAEYYYLLRTMVAQLQDGHTAVMTPMEISKDWMKPDFNTSLIENRVLVTKVFNPDLVKQGIVPGVEITQVNGEEVHAYADRVIRPTVCSSTEQNRLVHMYDYHFLVTQRGEAINLAFRDARGKPFNRTITPTRQWFEAASNARTFEYKLLPGGIAYVALNYFDHESIEARFDSIYPQLKAAKALILDVRNNGGGNSQHGWNIVAKLTNKDFPMGKWQTRNYKPTYRAWGNKQEWSGDQYIYTITRKDTADYFHGPVAVLTSGKTNSAAEDFLSAFTQAKRGKLIGEPSSGSTGQPLFVAMPGGGAAIICTKRDALYDGTEWVGKGFQPDVLVRPTVADMQQGKDTVLQKAVEVLNQAGKPTKL